MNRTSPPAPAPAPAPVPGAAAVPPPLAAAGSREAPGRERPRNGFARSLRAGLAGLATLAPGVWLASGAAFAVQLAALWRTGGYGIFRDELYYLACADHLAWGYVDHPPLSIAVLAAWRALFGESLLALRLPAFLIGAALPVLVALLARELGGGRRAQVVAAVAVAVAPTYLAAAGFYSMNAFDLLFWIAAALAAARAVGRDEPRWWLAFGAAVGLGLLDKLSVGFFAAAVALALAVTPARRHLRTRYPWLGAALAFVLYLPHLVWQAAHGWPTLEFIANARQYKMAAMGPGELLAETALQLHPATAVVWLAGLVWLLFAAGGRRFRLLGVAVVGVVALLVATQAKPYYLTPAFLVLFAAGGVAVEALVARLRGAAARTAASAALVVVLVGAGLSTLPLAVPILPVDRFIAYQERLGLVPSSGERSALGVLPQHYADRFGWEEMAATVAGVWRALPAAERETTLIVAGNYGEAGALRYFGPRYGLPAAASQHNSYYLWGPGRPLAEVTTVLVVGAEAGDLDGTFAEVTLAARLDLPYAMPYENGDRVWIARKPKMPLAEAWKMGKRFI